MPLVDYPLDTLLYVRQHKEKQARMMAEAAVRATHEAEKALEQARCQLNDYRQWRKDEEDRRYAAVLGQQLGRDEVNAFRAGLTVLGEEESRLTVAINEAAQMLTLRREEETHAAELLRQAVKAHVRIDEHRAIWRQEAEQEAERAEEKELDGPTG